jgi:hypothetical protein
VLDGAELPCVRVFERSVDWKSDENVEILVLMLGAVGASTKVVVFKTGRKGADLEGMRLDASGVATDKGLMLQPVPEPGSVDASGMTTAEANEEAVTTMSLPRSLWSAWYSQQDSKVHSIHTQVWYAIRQ